MNYWPMGPKPTKSPLQSCISLILKLSPGHPKNHIARFQTPLKYHKKKKKTLHTSPKPQTSLPKVTLPFRKLVATEAQAKRAKGIYFRCGEKSSVGHICKKKERHVLLFSEGNEMLWEGGEDVGRGSEVLEDV